MVNEKVLLDSLVALTETCKQQFIMLAMIGSEVDALRETVRGLDPTFDEFLEKNRGRSSLAQAALKTTEMLDDAILKLKAALLL